MSALDRLSLMPSWPARMTAPVAALYMGISETTFLNRYGAMGRKEGANTLWARAQLDLHIAKQFGLPHTDQPAWPVERDNSWDDLR
jgi:hypothetical protein